MNTLKQDVEKKYQFAVIATDVVIFTAQNGKLKVLLIEMRKPPYTGYWACPGGLVKPNESVDRAAQKHLFDKTGVKDVYLEQLYTFGEIDRDPFGRVVSVAYYALIPSGGIKLKTSHEYTDVDWFQVKQLPPMAYDHTEIIKVAVKRLKDKITYSNIVYSLLPKSFTLSELQGIYELILDKRLDKRNFRKKILTLNLITKTGRKRTGEANRPAQLYKFVRRTPQEVEVL